ncbi:hypothetical protein CYLTODRAFT_419621 [Cylindrobasidium torrendii FP15055 ss-10]|uniref:Alpha/beta-hydrolase n=1 Tax=Cylindrobasidium torrendii FP15055 ss-10 TaxID=1314674 RepID=A0A0D7BKA7_9AGAR|nr:hypothetical protein CYLTODRAFT_419621 [Cylindrobasidium torrendii FP15055 ss-10]
MIAPLFLALAVPAALASSSVNFHATHKHHSRAQYNEDPTVAGDPDNGWQEIPQVTDATIVTNWVVDEKQNASIPVYITANQDPANVQRAVIALAGKTRDCWYYFNAVNNALYNAAEQNPDTVSRDTQSIMSPCFFSEVDVTAGAVSQGQTVWSKSGWIDGEYNKAPDSVSKLSSFAALDSLIDSYMDKNTFPNLKVVVIAGHSAGAQMAQRYLALRNTKDNDDRLHYWIGNPGSFLWLTKHRPKANSTCEDVDEYKYGLGGSFPGYATALAKSSGRDGIVDQYMGRYAHYAFGLNDDGPGDTRCQAVTQGATHLERGSYFEALLKSLNGGELPSKTTFDYITNVSHDNIAMMNSGPGIDKLFKLDLAGSSASYDSTYSTGSSPINTTGSTDTSGDDDGDGAVGLQVHSIMALSLFSGLLMLL